MQALVWFLVQLVCQSLQVVAVDVRLVYLHNGGMLPAVYTTLPLFRSSRVTCLSALPLLV
jgi:hypothetical protein